MYIFLKFFCLVLSIMYGYRCVAGVVFKTGYSTSQILLASIGIAGFIILQWGL